MLLLVEFLESLCFVHGQMVRGVAFDQVLRPLLRGVDGVPLECLDRGELFYDRSPNKAGFPVPFEVISNLKVLHHG